MQTTHQEKEQKQSLAPADPPGEPLKPMTVSHVDTQDDDPDEIFLNAVAEIDTQPLVKKTPGGTFRWQDVFQTLLCVSLIGGSGIGLVWQLIIYPKTIVTLFPVTHAVTITTTLAVPLRTLTPVTVTRIATALATGHRHQDARSASGILTFYNGNASPQTVPTGTVFTGNDGVQVNTDQAVTIPAANPPYLGQATVTTSTLQSGSAGNIHPYDINGTVSSSVFVKNLAAFTGGRNARIYNAVAQQDIQSLTATLQKTLKQVLLQVFILRTNEALQTTDCATKSIADHALGDEAQTVTVKAAETCAAVAYNQDTLRQRAAQVFTAQTTPGKPYALYGSVHLTVLSVMPFQVKLMGTWVYVLSQDYEQFLAEEIAGETPDQARTFLLRTGVISQASVPDILPQAMYIRFLVLMG